MTFDYDDTLIAKVITNNLTDRLSKSGKEIVLFFSNYRLIETMRLIDNKTLKLARNRAHSVQVAGTELAEAEKQFESCLKEVYKVQGLPEMLRTMLSEILLNIDSAKGVSPCCSQRFNDAQVIKK